MDEDVLEGVGLSKNEAKVYCSLLKTGLCTASKLSEISKVHRTNVYDALERLMQKGLVNTSTTSKIRKFRAVPPERLHTFLDDKKRMLDEIMPKLTMLAQESSSHEQAFIMRGVQGIRSVLDDALYNKKDIFAYGLNSHATRILHPFMDWFHAERIEKKQQLQIIYDTDAIDRMKQVNKFPFTKARYQPQKNSSLMAVIIYGDKVALWTWEEPIFVISIDSSVMAESFRRNFKILWDIAK